MTVIAVFEMCLFLRYKLIPPACFLSKKIYIGIYIFFFIKGNVKKQSKYIQCGDFGKQNILLRHLYVQHRQSKSILRQPNNLREPYIYLLCMGHSTPITGRNCICTISCQLDTSTVFKMIYVICIAHSQASSIPQRIYGYCSFIVIFHNSIIFFAAQRFQAL